MNDINIIGREMSNNRYRKIFSVYKDLFNSSVSNGSRQMIEFVIYAKNVVNQINDAPMIMESKFSLDCVQAGQANVNTHLQKLSLDNNFECCYNITTDNLNRRMINVYVKYLGSSDLDYIYLHINKCPFENAFIFYDNYPSTAAVQDSTTNGIYKQYETYTNTINIEDSASFTINLDCQNNLVVAEISVTIPMGTHNLSQTDFAEFIPTKYKPNRNVGNYYRKDGTNTINFTLWNTGKPTLYSTIGANDGISITMNFSWFI